MKIAVSSSGNSLDSPVDPRFGRSSYYVIIDTDNMEFKAITNPNVNAPSGAGIGAAQLVAQKGMDAVLTGNVGPNALQVLSQAGIKIVTGAIGSVRDSIEKYKKGELTETVSTYSRGFYSRRGGRGMGLGRGMGRGISQNVYPYPTNIRQTETMSKEGEKSMLKDRLMQLEKELTEIKKKLEDMK